MSAAPEPVGLSAVRNHPYGLTHPTWRHPSCFYYDSPEAARAAIVKVYGEDSGHLVVGVLAAVPRDGDPTGLAAAVEALRAAIDSSCIGWQLPRDVTRTLHAIADRIERAGTGPGGCCCDLITARLLVCPVHPDGNAT